MAILSADSSGDVQAAALVQHLRPLLPGWKFVGVGGQLSRQAGVELWADSSLWSIVGLAEACSRLPRFLWEYWRIRNRLLRERPRLTVVIDAPAAHMRLAAVLKRHGLRNCYYFPPSGWSRNPRRLRDIHARSDALIPAFAYSAQGYTDLGLPVGYFGHPLVDLCQPQGRSQALAELGLAEGHYAGLLPGSRTQEIRLLLPVFVETARLLRQQFPELTWLLPCANQALAERIRQVLPQPPSWLRLIEGQSRAVMEVSQGALLASGSATLEACLLDLPHLICYRFNPFDYGLARLLLGLGLLKVDYFGLPNLVLQRRVIPEFFQDQVEPAHLAVQLAPLLQSGPVRQQHLQHLAQVRHSLGEPGALGRVAQFVAGQALA